MPMLIVWKIELVCIKLEKLLILKMKTPKYDYLPFIAGVKLVRSGMERRKGVKRIAHI